MKIRKVLMVVTIGIGLAGFASVSMAQGAPETKGACDYLTQDDISSVLGASYHQSATAFKASCGYMDSQDARQGAEILIVATGLSSETLNNAYQKILNTAKPLEGIGAIAAETQTQGMGGLKITNVFIYKNGTIYNVSASASADQSQSKAEALAKLLASKL